MFSNVFIGTPTHYCKRYCAEEFVRASIAHAVNHGAHHEIICNSKADAQTYYVGDWLNWSVGHLAYCHVPEIHQLYHGEPWSIHARITETMNQLLRRFLQSGREWFLSLESDCILQSNTLERMLAYKLPVVHSNCYPGFHRISIGKVDRITLGCTLINRAVFEAYNISFRFDARNIKAFHDAWFAHDCNEHEVMMWYDEGIVVPHRHSESGTRGWDHLPPTERD